MFDKTLQGLLTLSLPNSLNLLPASKLNVGDRVRWFRVPTQDFGTVVDRFYGTEGSVHALGWHYLIQLDPHSPSFAHCKTDCGFEEDLALIEKHSDATEPHSD